MIHTGRTPLIFAHRGASAHAPENTIMAFELAIEHGANVIELDAQLSADGHIVVIHDAKVDRTTNGTGHVHELTLVELKQLDASCNHDPRFKGETIPTLEEVLKILSNRIAINIELSNYRFPFNSLPDKVAQLIDDLRLQENLLISSFNPLSLRRFHQLKPEIPIGLLVNQGFLATLTGSKLGELMVSYGSIHLEKNLLNQKLIDRYHQHRWRVYPFTINSVSEMIRILSLKVDGIITDDPRTARSVIASLKPFVNDDTSISKI